MNKLFWLTTIACSICIASAAQQAADSADKGQLQTDVSSLLFSNFTYNIKDFNKVLLQWAIDSAGDNDYFIVERGRDTLHFETLGVLKKTGSSAQYELTDNNALSGFNYYRIKCTDSAGFVIYSKVLQVGISGRADFKFYPNPADKLLIIETTHQADLQILNSLGAVLISKQLQSGVQIINVSSLEKGDYVLRIADKESNRVFLEHLLKN